MTAPAGRRSGAAADQNLRSPDTRSRGGHLAGIAWISRGNLAQISRRSRADLAHIESPRDSVAAPARPRARREAGDRAGRARPSARGANGPRLTPRTERLGRSDSDGPRPGRAVSPPVRGADPEGSFSDVSLTAGSRPSQAGKGSRRLRCTAAAGGGGAGDLVEASGRGWPGGVLADKMSLNDDGDDDDDGGGGGDDANRNSSSMMK